jgi:DNA modification methylase
MRTELVWEGKYDEFGVRRDIGGQPSPLPLQLIETIDEPRSRAVAQKDFFDEKTAHSDDFRNRLIWGASHIVAPALAAEFSGSIQAVYIDPPFDVDADFRLNIPVGDDDSQIFKEQSIIEMVAFRDTWGRGRNSYLSMLYESLTDIRPLIAESGLIFLHIGQNVSHYAKILMDDVFGSSNFVNQIIWKRQSAHSDTKQGATHLGRVHDVILVYSKSENYLWNTQYEPYSQEYIRQFYRHIDPDTGRRFRLSDTTGPGGAGKGNPKYEFLGVTRFWRFKKEKMEELYQQGRIVQTKPGSVPQQKRYLDEMPGVPLQDIWTDVASIQPHGHEITGYSTQKPEKLLERILSISSNEGDVVADFFVGSGTTLAVAERLGRRWIGCDLGRFAIHTSRKRLIGVQRKLHESSKSYRSFDVYNLGRYERQWWQKEALKGADDEHRKVVLKFFRAEKLTQTPSPLLHGRKGTAFVHVDGIDSIFSRGEVVAVTEAVKAAGGREAHCLAWDFEMDIRQVVAAVEVEHGVKVRLHRIPREIMERNRTEVPPFFEVALLEAGPVYRKNGKSEKSVDIKLENFLPSLTEVPSKELEALQERAVKSGFDFIDFWAVDFDWKPGQPFNHHWQEYRTRKDRSLKTVSDAEFVYERSGKHTACVKVVDVFGCDTSITVEVEI